MGLSQVALAAKIGLTAQGLWRIEAGEVVNPRIEVLTGLADALGVTLDELMRGESTTAPASEPAASER